MPSMQPLDSHHVSRVVLPLPECSGDARRSTSSGHQRISSRGGVVPCPEERIQHPLRESHRLRRSPRHPHSGEEEFRLASDNRPGCCPQNPFWGKRNSCTEKSTRRSTRNAVRSAASTVY